MLDAYTVALRRILHLRKQLEDAHRAGNTKRAKECERLIAELEALMKAPPSERANKLEE